MIKEEILKLTVIMMNSIILLLKQYLMFINKCLLMNNLSL